MKFKEKRIFQYIGRFGLYHGLKIFFGVRRARSKDLLSFKIPGLKENVLIRRKSSDFLVFEEIFIDECYKISPCGEIKYIVDAGANIGLAALYFMWQFPNVKIICIEPESANFTLLKKNTQNYSNVIRYKAGLWNKKGFLKITNSKDESWAFMVEEISIQEGNLRTVTIEDILAENPTDRIDIIKIDIEGSEKEVFEKNIDWVEKTKYLIVEIHEDTRIGAKKSVMSALKNFEHQKVFENYYFLNTKL